MKTSPEMKALQERKARFMATVGLTKSAASACLMTLAGRQCQGWRRFDRKCPGCEVMMSGDWYTHLWDHAYGFSQMGRRLHLIVTHPYNFRESDVPVVRTICRLLGLECHIYPPERSWYAPRASWMLIWIQSGSDLWIPLPEGECFREQPS